MSGILLGYSVINYDSGKGSNGDVEMLGKPEF